MWFHNRVPLGPCIPGIILLYVRRIMYQYRVLLPLLLLLCTRVVAAAAAAVRHRVPDGKIVAGSLNLIPSSVFFLFIQTRFFKCMYPLAVLSHLRARFAYTSSVITGIRGAKAAVGPPRRSPPCDITVSLSLSQAKSHPPRTRTVQAVTHTRYLVK